MSEVSNPEPPDDGEPEVAMSLEMELPPEVEAGIYADFARIWSTRDIFVIDFVASKQPPVLHEDPETNEQSYVVPAKVVARLRIPPDQVFELAKGLTQHLTKWESATGRRAPYEGPPV